MKSLVAPPVPTVRPNHALKQVREVTGWSQAQLADRVGLSAPYIQAVEQGVRSANSDLAMRLMGACGVSHECISGHAASAVDVWGQPFASDAYRVFQSIQPDQLSEQDWDGLLQPFRDLFRAAASTGRLRILCLWLRSKLEESIEHIDGLQVALNKTIEERASTTASFTYGLLRSDPRLAQQLGFSDDPTKLDEEIALETKSVASQQPDWFTSQFWRSGGHEKRADFVVRFRGDDPCHQNILDFAKRLRAHEGEQTIAIEAKRHTSNLGSKIEGSDALFQTFLRHCALACSSAEHTQAQIPKPK